jgi:hypothetical protein
MSAITELCTRALLLESGRVARSGAPEAIVSDYLKQNAGHGRAELPANDAAECAATWVETLGAGGRAAGSFEHGERVTVRVGVRSRAAMPVVVGVGVRDAGGHQILHFCNADDRAPIDLPAGESTVDLTFENPLNEGSYYLTLWLGKPGMETYDYRRDCLRFEATTASLGRRLARPAVIVDGDWNTRPDRAMAA